MKKHPSSDERGRSLMELERLRDIGKQVEVTSAEIMARIDKLVQDVPEPSAPRIPN